MDHGSLTQLCKAQNLRTPNSWMSFIESLELCIFKAYSRYLKITHVLFISCKSFQDGAVTTP